ncbi:MULTISPECIES: LamB/YcsF family protein [unclassified Knoellia]|uniref:LamB/YcsF family protein n=1 Tax=Knoellia altitudinis TaxID=3404795 RepID=UPI003618900C
MSAVVDLNSDLGEGFGRWTLGDDEAMLDLVTSANVACGFHAGDPSILRRVCARAAERGVAVGAQVGYRDLAGFGRRHIDVDPAELVNEVIYQIGALDGIARVEGSRVIYVKPHGALYNDAASNQATARAVAEAIALYDRSLPLVGLAGSELLVAAEAAGLEAVAEAFADRAYTAEGLLASRREDGAVLHDPVAIAARCVRLVTDGTIDAIDGSSVPVAARSICVHGDTEGAVAIAAAVRRALEGAGITIQAFTAPPPPSSTASGSTGA